MIKLINKVLFYLKIILLLISFSLSLYILFSMHAYFGNQLLAIISIFIPMFLALIAFVVSFFFHEGQENIVFNLACCIALLAISIICFRTLLDKNMVLWIRGDANFYYFQNQMMQIKILIYSMFLGNVILIYKEKKENIIETL